MDVPPSGFRPPPDGHEFPDFVETPKQSKYQNDNYQDHRKSEPVYQALRVDKYLSSSNDDLSGNAMHEEDVYSRPSNLLYTKSQSLIDMSIYSKEKLSNQRKRSKLKGLVIPETPETDLMPQVNIPEIKSITPLPTHIENGAKDLYKSVSTTPSPPVSSVILPSWTANTNLPKYSPAFKRKSLHVYPTIITKQTDSYSEESSYDEYINTSQSRHSDDLKSLESISSPTRSDYNFDYLSAKIMTIKDNKDHVDSDNDSAVSSSQSSFNSRSSPPPSYTSDEKFNAPEKNEKSNIEAINRKNILSDAKCRSGQDTKTSSVLQKVTSIEERRNSKEEQVQIRKELPKQDIFENFDKKENIVLKGVPDTPILVNEPVVLEVAVESAITPDKSHDSVTNPKPVPTKRTLATAPAPKERTSLNEKPKLKQRCSLNESKYFNKQNQQASVQSLKATFEKNDTGPLLPKAPVPLLYNRRKSDEILMSLSNKDQVTIRQKYEQATPVKSESRRASIHNAETPKVESRRSSINNKIEHISTAESRRSSINNKIENIPTIENRRASLQKKYTESSEKTPVVKRDITKPNSLNIISSPGSVRNDYATVEIDMKQGDGPLGVHITGGIDQEEKNIMINRIRYGSRAYKDGRLKKGDKIISINHEPCDGMTNADATALLKEKSSKFIIVVEESYESLPFTPISKRSSSLLSLTSETKGSSNSLNIEHKQPTHSVSIIKDGAGLGFSIEGGRDSPKGDVPLIIKKLFAGGAADKCGQLRVGDEILAINGFNFQNLSRVDAWSQMKKMPDGPVKIDIFR